MRYFLTFIALAALAALIILAPQGLVTKPAYSKAAIGPWILVYDKCATAEDGEKLRLRLQEELHQAEIETGLPFLIQPSLDAMRGESLEPFDTGFLLPVEPYLHMAEALGYKTLRVGECQAIQAAFPLRGSLSIPLGNWKINERIRRRAAKQGYQSDQLIQLFNREQQTITYIVPQTALELK